MGALAAWTFLSPRAWGWSGGQSGKHGYQIPLPMSVGMVRAKSAKQNSAYASPHERGDGPFDNVFIGMWGALSPRAWGWSDRPARPLLVSLLLPRAWGCSGPTGPVHAPRQPFPTGVGMVRTGRARPRMRRASPHGRGDGPTGKTLLTVFHALSPQAWGRSDDLLPADCGPSPFPTSVGMVRICRRSWIRPCALSPRAWGWSEQIAKLAILVIPLPTSVGMVRASISRNGLCTSFPHGRGDGPVYDDKDIRVVNLSPRERGWTGGPHERDWLRLSFPTGVGMVRPHSPHAAQTRSLSPRTWGWSMGVATPRDDVAPLPTGVGMVRTGGVRTPWA